MTKGLQRAGFHVTGVDIEPQPNYCGDAFRQADALTFPLDGYDLICASPMCQAHTWAAKRWGKDWPNQIPETRRRLRASGLPYVIENVPGAPLENPVRLCGLMFGLGVLRHRHFESNMPLLVPPHPRHMPPVTREAKDGSGRPVKRSRYVTVAGHGGESASYAYADWCAAMGIDWMTKEELTQAIPPAYGEFIGRQVMSYLTGRQEAAA